MRLTRVNETSLNQIEGQGTFCVECGKTMHPGGDYSRYCEYGGYCSRYVPRALRAIVKAAAGDTSKEV